MGFADAVRSGINNYVTFTGRAGRSEYWYWVLFSFLVNIGASIVFGVIHVSFLANLVSLALLLPSIAVGVRRLHDLDKSGWWLLVGLIPILGWIYLIYLAVQPGTAGANRFGPPPMSIGTAPAM